MKFSTLTTFGGTLGKIMGLWQRWVVLEEKVVQFNIAYIIYLNLTDVIVMCSKPIKGICPLLLERPKYDHAIRTKETSFWWKKELGIIKSQLC